ncbi:non-lysosomal glucosylceramidase [Venturia canescens]|uniref:non-lysosomal glucosylceramidase n=1 Tax=Venturia canescens TaxID=32260 RepID=UPI001C9CF3DA|nr:non-lysosomal glucosylceramidase [Venturia canescens]
MDTGGITEIPRYGFKVRLDHEFPEKWSPSCRLRLSQLYNIVVTSWRYVFYYWNAVKRKKKLPCMDFFYPRTGMRIYGAPIGGLGAGTMGRGFKGEFCRNGLVPGIYQYNIVDANRFIVTIRSTDGNTLYQRVLSPGSSRKRKNLSSWDWNYDGKDAFYTALYPRSWTVYEIPQFQLRLICRQISPVIPHNYKDSSLPCAIFVWQIDNSSNRDFDISITFVFQSGQGNENSEGDKWNESFEYEDDTIGVMIHQQLNSMPCTYAVAGRSRSGVFISRKVNFDPSGDGRDLWTSLNDTGKLDSRAEKNSEKTKKETACAVCASTFVAAGETRDAEFSLVWDMPKIHFVDNRREWMRFYTTYFHDDEKSVAPEISNYALKNYASWENDIHKWQSEVLDDEALPDWYKSALFNELYYVADGGTVWLRPSENDHFPVTDPRHKYGRFAYLEGHEYRMYNTYDVNFYASFALASLWPNLEASLQYEVRDAVQKTHDESRTLIFRGGKAARKVAGSVPHDMGDPSEEPFERINAYPIHDVSNWKDLNPKFVLSCYRDYAMTGNSQQLKDFWVTLKEVIEHSMRSDKDGDGLIENSGIPDHTYDLWMPEGPSSYCGSLWLGALRCFTKIAEILDHKETAMEYEAVLAKASEAFQEKLWNGHYYNFDSSKSIHQKVIMSDQLCGQWYLQACGFGHEIFPEDRVKSALRVIFHNNVIKFKDGQQGAVNGYVPGVGIDTVTVQSEEMWTGVTYGLAALMIHEGMIEEGFQTAEGVYRTVYEKIGLGFETPEALQENKVYRSIGYMRPLAIWGIQHAWKIHKERSAAATG